MNTQLSTLLKHGDPPGEGDAVLARTRRRDFRSRLAGLLPWLLLIGFLALLAGIFGNRLLPARELTIATVVTIRQSAEEANSAAKALASSPARARSDDSASRYEGPMLFQASGWVEPDPYPVKATALIDGVISTVSVLEGERVEKGQELAALIDDDARLDLETARARLESLLAQLDSHHQQIAAAEAQLGTLEKSVIAALARKNEAQDLAERLTRATRSGVAEREITQARLELATREAEVEALAATEAELKANLIRHEKMHVDFEARISEAKTDIARKQLALDRTRIPAPISGRILRLLATPGQKRMLGMDDPESATIAVLYDPESLQARIDVPLSEAAQLAIGQPVRLRSELLPDRVFQGHVSRIVGEADLQRNTLQAKVTILDPDDRLRPDMLCRAEFLATPESNASSDPRGPTDPRTSNTRIRIFLPKAALAGAETSPPSDQRTIWKVDASGERVTPQQIELGKEEREDHQLVLEGLRPGDRVVLAPPSDLKPGERFRPSPLNETSTPSTES